MADITKVEQARVDFPVPASNKARFQEAAVYETGGDLSSFLVAAGLERAERVLGQVVVVALLTSHVSHRPDGLSVAGLEGGRPTRTEFVAIWSSGDGGRDLTVALPTGRHERKVAFLSQGGGHLLQGAPMERSSTMRSTCPQPGAV